MDSEDDVRGAPGSLAETAALCVPAEVRMVGERSRGCVPRLDLSTLWTEGPGAPCAEAGHDALSARVREWLADLGLNACVPAFEAAGVTAESLLEWNQACSGPQIDMNRRHAQNAPPCGEEILTTPFRLLGSERRVFYLT